MALLNQDFSFSMNSLTFPKIAEGGVQILERYFALFIESWVARPDLGFNYKYYIQNRKYQEFGVDLASYLKASLTSYFKTLELTRLRFDGRVITLNYILNNQEGVLIYEL